MLQEQTGRFFNDILLPSSQFETRSYDCDILIPDQLNLQPVVESDPLHKHCMIMIAIITLT